MGILRNAREMTPQEISNTYNTARNAVVNDLITRKFISNASEATVRQAILGDSSATDGKDLTAATTVGTGMQEWSIDSAALTAGDLKNVITATSGAQSNEVAESTAIAFYGFIDLSGTKDLIALSLGKGAKTIEFFENSPTYAYSDSHISYVDPADVVLWSAREVVKINMEGRVGLSAVAGEDYRWTPLLILAEPKSKSVWATSG